MMLILGFNGHPLKKDVGDRKANVAHMLDASLAAARKEARFFGRRATTKTIHLVDVIKGHHDGIEESIPDWIRPTLELTAKADGLIFATPVNWFDKSDLMHTFISYLTGLEMAGFALENKKVAALAHEHDGGGILAAALMMMPMNHMGCDIIKYGLFYRNPTWAHLSEVTEPEVGKGWMDVDNKLTGQNMTRAILEAKGVKIDMWGFRI